MNGIENLISAKNGLTKEVSIIRIGMNICSEREVIMIEELTEKQRDLLDKIREFTVEERLSPSVRDLGGRLKWSISTVFKQLRELRDKGYIELKENVSRGIVLKKPLSRTVLVPILGSIPAGEPVLSEEFYNGHIELDASFATGEGLFALKVEGDSMIGANILDGDTAIIRAQDDAQSGEIVAARIDGEATLKRFVIRSGKPMLCPENDKYRPIELSENRGPVRILGQLVAVLRRY